MKAKTKVAQNGHLVTQIDWGKLSPTGKVVAGAIGIPGSGQKKLPGGKKTAQKQLPDNSKSSGAKKSGGKPASSGAKKTSKASSAKRSPGRPRNSAKK